MTAEISPQSDVIISDLEWSGKLNRALGQGDKFALLLAMLEDDYLRRPNINGDSDEPSLLPSGIAKHYYPQTPLHADQQDWSYANTTSKLLSQNAADALLWQKMHPQPLSQYNDAKRIDPDVMLNCGYPTQQRAQQTTSVQINVDETRLYDILNSLS